MIRVGNEEVNICIINVYFGAFPNYFPFSPGQVFRRFLLKNGNIR